MLDTLPELDHAGLQALAASQVQVLTVNNRHARRLLARFSEARQDGRKVIQVPSIVPYSAWVAQLADDLAFLPEAPLGNATLDTFGVRLLWRQVIRAVEAGNPLLDDWQAARLAADADRLIDDWGVQVDNAEATEDYQQFMLWRRAYHGERTRLELDDAGSIMAALLAVARSGRMPFAFSHLVLAGFNELPPRLAALLQCLEHAGVTLYRLAQPGVPAADLSAVVAPDAPSEWQLAARWAAENLAARPQGRFAIVAASLEGDMPLAHRVLGSVVGQAYAWNIAVGRPLTHWPLPRAALAWLQVVCQLGRQGGVSAPYLGAALLAGGCSAAHEAGARAGLDARWRRQEVLWLGREAIGRAFDKHAPALASAWQQAAQAIDAWPTQAGAAQWAGHFRHALQCLGFPGQGALDTVQYQQLEAFEACLQHFAEQSAVLNELPPGPALAVLVQLATETLFQPRRDPSARLDVLGFLEAEGGQWDAVWVLGLTDDVLPALPKPNPLVPVAALRRAGAPRATPERELAWARSLFQALSRCAPVITFSYAAYEGERELRPSPFIQHLSAEPAEPPGPAGTALMLEAVADQQGPPLPSGQLTGGGLGVIDTQARNPLWAFVKYRLGATLLPDYARMPSRRRRGEFLHDVAEQVWKALESRAGLLQAGAQGRLPDILQQACADAAARHLSSYPQAARQLESGRGMRLMAQWLELEAERPDFRIHAVERDAYWRHGELQLRLRLDRIDELEDGRLLVIDYKTGNGRIDPRNDWSRPRPVDLQLPFYASLVASETAPVAGLALVGLHPRELQVRGLADGDTGLPGLQVPDDWPSLAGADWQTLLQSWAQAIRGLADEFNQGVAVNLATPDDIAHDLQFCDVLPMLRLHEVLPDER